MRDLAGLGSKGWPEMGGGLPRASLTCGKQMVVEGSSTSAPRRLSAGLTVAPYPGLPNISPAGERLLFFEVLCSRMGNWRGGQYEGRDKDI